MSVTGGDTYLTSARGLSRELLGGDSGLTRGLEELGSLDSRSLPTTASSRYPRNSVSSSCLDFDSQSDQYSTNLLLGNDYKAREPIVTKQNEMEPELDDDHGNYSYLNNSGYNGSLSHSPARSRTRTDLNGSRNGWTHDADSGISNSFSPRRTYRSSSSLNASMSSPHKSLLETSMTSPGRGGGTLGQDLQESPRDRLYRTNSVTSLHSQSLGPVKYGSTFDLSRALDDSEGRRQLLVERLKDAQDTIRLQSQRLNQVESCAKDASFQVDDLKYKETSMKKRLEMLDRERKTFQEKEMESLKAREELFKKLDSSDMEVKTLRSSYNLLQSDNEKKKEVIDQTRAAMNMLEEDNRNLTKVEGEDLSELEMINSPLHNITFLHYRDKAKESMMREVNAMKQSLEITRSRNEYLENQAQDTKIELDRLREDNRTLLHESTEMHKKYTELKGSTGSLRDENAALSAGLQALNDEKTRFLRKQTEQDTTISDLKASMSSLSADRERFFQEKLDMTQKIQSLIHDLEQTRKNKLSIEDQVNDLNVDLAQAKLEVDKHREEKSKLQDELSAVKKVGEVLSVELANTKCNLEKTTEQLSSLEQTKQIAFQQHDLYEQEIKTLEAQVENMRRSMDTLRRDHMKEKEKMDEHVSKIKDELRQVKGERNQLELKCHEQEARIKQTETNLKEHSEVLTKEMDSWKNSCDKLSASLSRKELEIQTMMKKLHDLEDEKGNLKVNHDTYQSQYEELVEVREEYLKMQEENRRLLQERAENQQVIQLLEMQKNILSKTSEEKLGKAHDAQQLQIKVDQLTADNNKLEETIKRLQDEKEKINKELTQTKTSGEIKQLKNKVEEMEKENKQLVNVNNLATEKLATLENEKLTFQSQQESMVSKIEFVRMEREKETLSENYKHIKIQLEELEERHHKLLTQRQSAEKSISKEERADMESQITMLNSQLVLLENSKKRAEDSCVRLEKKVDDLQQQNFKSSQGQTAQAMNLQKQVARLQADLSESKGMIAKQEAVIHALREDVEVEKTKSPSTITQSLDDVGVELNQMRMELQKLLEVIQVKDQEIEELEEQLVVSKKQAASRQRLLDEMNNENHGRPNTKEQDEKMNSLEQEKGDLEDQIAKINEENDELSDQVARLKKEKERVERDNEDLRQTNDEIQSMLDEDRDAALLGKLRKELKAKDRQIECLEEQLQRSTNFEIKKLKRDAGRVEILQAENRRLSNQLKRTQSLNVKSLYADEDAEPFTPPSSSMELTKGRLKRLSAEIRERDADYLSDNSDKDSNHNVVGKIDSPLTNDDAKESPNAPDTTTNNVDTTDSAHEMKTAQEEFDKLFYESDESDEDVRRHMKQLSELKGDATDGSSFKFDSDESDTEASVDLSKPGSVVLGKPQADPSPVEVPTKLEPSSFQAPKPTRSKSPPPTKPKPAVPRPSSAGTVKPSLSSSTPGNFTSKECTSENCHYKTKGLAASKPISRSENKLSGIFPWQSNKSSNSLTRASLANKNRTRSTPDDASRSWRK